MNILTIALLVSANAGAGTLAQTQTAVPVDLQNGQLHYQDNCMVCHGDSGHGDDIAADNLRKKPANISRKLDSLFESDAELTRDVLKGKSVMPAFQGRLSKGDIQGIFAYIRSVN